MLHRTLTLELDSGKSLKLQSTVEGMEVTLGKAKTPLTFDEVRELQGAIQEIAGSKPRPPAVQPTPVRHSARPKLGADDDLPINPQ